MEPRLAEMGFVNVGENDWALDPNQHPEVWTKNENNEWQRVDKPTKYLAKASGSDGGHQRSYDSDSSDDFASVYLERVLRRMQPG